MNLIEKLKSLIEGDVIDFQAFKNAKNGTTDGSNALKPELREVKIGNVKILHCEGPIEHPWFNEGEVLSYEDFQDSVWQADYICLDTDKLDKLRFTCKIQVDGRTPIYSGKLTLGSGKDSTDLKNFLKRNMSNADNIVFLDEVKYDTDKYQKALEDYKANTTPKEEPEQTSPKLIEAKDYGEGKTGKDVQVGDILTAMFGYSMTLIEFYRVIKRTNASVQLEELEQKIVDGDGWQGTCVPVDASHPSTDVDGKNFRIKDFGNGYVCKVNGKLASYWNGNPRHFDRLD